MTYDLGDGGLTEQMSSLAPTTDYKLWVPWRFFPHTTSVIVWDYYLRVLTEIIDWD
jgi:hypothetical protein